MKSPRLVYPDDEHQRVVEQYVEEFQSHNSHFVDGIPFYESFNCYEDWLYREKKMHLGIDLDDGLVPGTTYLYMLDDDMIGCINIRHCLNENLLKVGGHIGYSISPRYRRQGYATQMLKEALKICQQWEIWPVLITCNKDNIASRKTIEKCSGILENQYSHDGIVTLRYWIGGEER